MYLSLYGGMCTFNRGRILDSQIPMEFPPQDKIALLTSMMEENQLGSPKLSSALQRYEANASACQNATLHPREAAWAAQMNDSLKLLRLYLIASKDADKRVKETSAKVKQMKEKCEKLEKIINSG
jgi:hypothetical protein